jgi:hypothetical protein
MQFTPEWLNRWRIWPRMIITLYGIAFYQTTNWFMDLADPTNAQAGFVSVVVGAGAGFFGIYVNGGTTQAVNNTPPPAQSKPSDDDR